MYDGLPSPSVSAGRTRKSDRQVALDEALDYAHDSFGVQVASCE